MIRIIIWAMMIMIMMILVSNDDDGSVGDYVGDVSVSVCYCAKHQNWLCGSRRSAG